MVSPLSLSALSNCPCWKLRVGRKPWALITFTRMGVPYLGSPPPVTGDAASFWTAARQAAMYSFGRATCTGCVPRAATALRFLAPITAPTPERPAARCLSLMMQAVRARRSPAGPMEQTLASAWVSALSPSSVSCVVLPQTAWAGRISARSWSSHR
jgi:hypothetical protein